jgi:LmbE family N-acetylglucosaminyl deacetylase
VKPLILGAGAERLSLLCIGAHSDDIEIGAGGLILTLARAIPELEVHWCVLSAPGPRAEEARASAAAFLESAARRTVEVADFDDTHFPEQSREIKAWLAGVRGRFSADVVLVHAREDAHQDHRELNRLAWNLFRDELILEYEITKWDGDLGRPNVYAALEPWALERKVELLMRHFGSQRSKDWFDPETFRGLARIRGMECRAPSRYAEAFTVRKAMIAQAAAAVPAVRAAE